MPFHRPLAALLAFFALLPVSTGPAVAAERTPWIEAEKAHAYVRHAFRRERYATAIECRADASGQVWVRFETQRGTDRSKPFFKWQFVVTEPGGIETAVSKIPLRERPDLYYRVVSRDRADNRVECAVVYR